MQRRELLEKMFSAALAAGLLTPLSLTAADSSGPEHGSTAETTKSLECQLRHLAMRDSSEQSTPMFLALENLAVVPGAPRQSPGQSSAQSPDQFPGPLNAELTAKFERYANLLLQYKSHPDESDAVALIVLMARQELVPDAMEDCL